MIDDQLIQLVELDNFDNLICKFYFHINGEFYDDIPQDIRNNFKILKTLDLETIEDYMKYFNFSDKKLEQIYFNLKMFQTGQDEKLAKETFDLNEFKHIIHMILDFAVFLFVEKKISDLEKILSKCYFTGGFTKQARNKLLNIDNLEN